MLENIERTWSRHCYGQGHCVTPLSNIAVLATNVIKMTEWPAYKMARDLANGKVFPVSASASAAFGRLWNRDVVGRSVWQATLCDYGTTSTRLRDFSRGAPAAGAASCLFFRVGIEATLVVQLPK
jgi:hypothetical protein